MLSLRTSAHAGVAIPRLEGKCIDNCPIERENLAIFGGNRYLVPFIRGIATPVCALARNDSEYLTNTNLLRCRVMIKAFNKYCEKGVPLFRSFPKGNDHESLAFPAYAVMSIYQTYNRRKTK